MCNLSEEEKAVHFDEIDETESLDDNFYENYPKGSNREFYFPSSSDGDE